MDKLRFRQVHLDFHTSEKIGNIGGNFVKEEFQAALKVGHVNSITIFSKCHHGWAYHPSEKNRPHPHLQGNLLGKMIDAAHEIDVKVPVYISAGLDEKMALVNPQWLIRDENDSTNWVDSFLKPGYHQFCFNSPYLPYLLEQVEEVVKNFDADGIFLDIVGERKCYCHNCINTLIAEGKDPLDENEIEQLGIRTYANYTKKIRETIDKYKPGLPVFHNGGHVTRGRRELAFANTHLELESLPTGGWGYDHFPLSARYVQGMGMEFLGMTGKFHTTWGEFGGYKHPNALRYEAALSIANGAKCSIGDQMHPEGKMDLATYELIGAAYKEVEEKEAYCHDVQSIADVGFLSAEACIGSPTRENPEYERYSDADVGVTRILLEANILFDVLDLESDFSKYKVVILPDAIRINDKISIKLEKFLSDGGKLLASGQSGLHESKDEFAIDFGIKYLCEKKIIPDYFKPNFNFYNIGDASVVCYNDGVCIALDGASELGVRQNSYFNRTPFNFCSHQHTPNSFENEGVAMTENKNGIYLAWDIFGEYATKGSLAQKEIVVYGLNKLLGDSKSIETSLGAQGVTTIMHQQSERRYIHHSLYASPVKRGRNIEVIEDLMPVYDIDCKIKLPVAAKNVVLVPQNEKLDFTQAGDTIVYTIPKVLCHQMVSIEY